MFSALFLRISEVCPESAYSGFLRQNTSLARLAVLLVLSAACCLVFWQSRAAIFWAPQKGCPLARVFTAFQRMMLANPRKQGIPEHPTRKRSIYKGFRGSYPETPYPRGVRSTYLEHLYRRGFTDMSFRVFDHDEAPNFPLGAAAGAGSLAGTSA